MPPKKSKSKSKSKHAPKKPAKKHGTRAYQKDEGGPSWDRDHKKPPDVDDIMAIIERSPEDLELYRRFLVDLDKDPAMKNLSMTERMNVAEMNMLREKIMRWMLEVDSPDRLEELRESNKMLRFIWQVTDKILREARERAPMGGDLEGLSQVIDDAEDAEYKVEDKNEEVEDDGKEGSD